MEHQNSLHLPQISSLSKHHVKIKDIDIVEKKINTIIKGGNKLLQVITDFDRTLTKSDIDGVPSPSSHCIFETCTDLPESYINECRNLCDKYYPIETSPIMTVEEKIPHMVEWWKLSENLCQGIVIDKHAIDKAVISANVQFRDGCNVMLKRLSENSVPVLVLSAGIGDVINSVLHNKSFDYPNLQVISNFFKFEGSKIIGYSTSALHTFNKNQHAVENSQYFDKNKHRTNVILLGDSIGDANMDEGLPQHSTVLKIGFLSCSHNDQYLSQYMDRFDIVLVNDNTMEVPMEIIDCVL